MSDQSKALAIPSDFASRLMAGIAESRATTQLGAGGKPILRLMKGGDWVYGATNEELQPGSRWVVNPMTLAHGWCCWVDGGDKAKNSLEGDIMVSMADRLPPEPEPIDGTEWKEQRAFELKCLDGDDAGTEVVYKVNSYGGIQAVTKLIGSVQQRLLSSHPCAVLTFDSEWYQHVKWGRVDKPIFNIVGWADMDGNLADSPAGDLPPPLAAAAAAPAAPARKRKAPLTPDTPPAQAAAPATAAVRPEPVPTAQVHVGQRRRPAAR